LIWGIPSAVLKSEEETEMEEEKRRKYEITGKF